MQLFKLKLMNAALPVIEFENPEVVKQIEVRTEIPFLLGISVLVLLFLSVGIIIFLIWGKKRKIKNPTYEKNQKIQPPEHSNVIQTNKILIPKPEKEQKVFEKSAKDDKKGLTKHLWEDEVVTRTFLTIRNLVSNESFTTQLEEDFVIGRTEGDLVFNDDGTLSRKHCVLFKNENLYFLRDLNSSNGTYLNSQRLNRDIRITNGDIIQIGRQKLAISFKEDTL